MAKSIQTLQELASLLCHLLQLLGQICICSGGEVQTSAAYSDTNFIIAYCSCNSV